MAVWFVGCVVGWLAGWLSSLLAFFHIYHLPGVLNQKTLPVGFEPVTHGLKLVALTDRANDEPNFENLIFSHQLVILAKL